MSDRELNVTSDKGTVIGLSYAEIDPVNESQSRSRYIILAELIAPHSDGRVIGASMIDHTKSRKFGAHIDGAAARFFYGLLFTPSSACTRNSNF